MQCQGERTGEREKGRKGGGEIDMALPVGASVTDGASTFRLDVPAPLHPTFSNGIWGGRIVKNAGKTAVFPPPSPTVRVSQALHIMPAIFFKLTFQSAKRLDC